MRIKRSDALRTHLNGVYKILHELESVIDYMHPADDPQQSLEMLAALEVMRRRMLAKHPAQSDLASSLADSFDLEQELATVRARPHFSEVVDQAQQEAFAAGGVRKRTLVVPEQPVEPTVPVGHDLNDEQLEQLRLEHPDVHEKLMEVSARVEAFKSGAASTMKPLEVMLHQARQRPGRG